MRTLAALIAGGLIATAAALGTPAAHASPAATATPQPRILNYNTMLLTVAGDWDHENRAKRIGNADFVQGNDVVVLEEVFRNQKPAAGILFDTLKNNGYTYRTPIVGATDGTRPGDNPRWNSSDNSPGSLRLENGGVVIASKHPIDYMASRVYKVRPCGADQHAAKGFAYVRINFHGTWLHVIGTHTQADDTNCAKGAAEEIRHKQFSEIDAFIRGMHIPESETIVLSGDMNVDRHSPEYHRMLGALHAEAPDHNLGWPYSYDTQNNTIAKYRDGRQVNFPNNPIAPTQDLDDILLRKDHARPAVWNNKTLTGQYNWEMVSANHHYAYSDYSDHYPVVAGDVTEPSGRYELTVEKATLKRYNYSDNKTSYDPWDFGEITITGASGSTRDHQTVWTKPYKGDSYMKVGTDFPLSGLRRVRSDHGFAVHADVMDGHGGFIRNQTVAYGTAWWHNGDPEGRQTATLVGAYGGDIEITYTVRKMS
ncbi:endonuclease/exonuclease/phosphatase family protein [Kitasatospora sp. NPDC091335]|uniref:endonuclease/exonuclease/phosphatase family protein n=1 Tax=Kitasatospora sp. NPDC091335 TaxID=3364085 RepID=UPI0038252F3F